MSARHKPARREGVAARWNGEGADATPRPQIDADEEAELNVCLAMIEQIIHDPTEH